jgi:hypothetical protein
LSAVSQPASGSSTAANASIARHRGRFIVCSFPSAAPARLRQLSGPARAPPHA